MKNLEISVSRSWRRDKNDDAALLRVSDSNPRWASFWRLANGFGSDFDRFFRFDRAQSRGRNDVELRYFYINVYLNNFWFCFMRCKLTCIYVKVSDTRVAHIDWLKWGNQILGIDVRRKCFSYFLKFKEFFGFLL